MWVAMSVFATDAVAAVAGCVRQDAKIAPQAEQRSFPRSGDARGEMILTSLGYSLLPLASSRCRSVEMTWWVDWMSAILRPSPRRLIQGVWTSIAALKISFPLSVSTIS